MKRKIAAWIILIILVVVPFLNWELGAIFWLCAGLVFISQGLFKGKPLEIHKEEDDEKE